MASPSPSSRRALSKLRRNKENGNISSNTLASSSNSDDQNLEGTLTPPTDSTSKFRDKFRRKSADPTKPLPVSPDSGRRLSKFVNASRNRLAKTASNDIERSLSVDSESAGLGLSENTSEVSLVLDGSGGDSILTDDGSDREGKPVRPPLSTHPSHTGYLTLSAPEIDSQTVPVPTDATVVPSIEPLSATQSLPDIPAIIEPFDTASPDTSNVTERSQSVNDKVKGVFTSSRKDSSGDVDSLKSVGSGPGGGLFRPSSRSGSVNPDNSLASEGVVPPAQSESDLNIGQRGASEVRPETPRTGRPRVNTANRPATPPNLVETPTTYVTPPTPTDPSADAPTFSRNILQKSPSSPRSTSPSKDNQKTRKINLPSKLSQSVPAPLTPTVEEAKTPGGTLTQPANATGFFTTVFSAAQKAADSLSSSINTSIGSSPKSKSIARDPIQEEGGEEVIPGAGSTREVAWGETKQPAIDTIGSGDLNFSHLGISDSGGASPMTSTTDLPLQNGMASQVEEASKKAEQEAAARAVSEAYQSPVERVVSQAQGGRPLSIASNEPIALASEQTTPKAAADDALKRSGSVRSKISGKRRRRRRGTSGTADTGLSIAAGLSASRSGLGNLAANGAGKRLTGFAVASNKRNKDFHQLFRSVPEDDYLIEDYSAALQRDILLHGRLYVSEGHMCFSSNILGWVTNLVISFDEVVSVEKKSTAVIFPNALVITTLHSKNTFASFVARDSTYELIIGIWKTNHPNLKTSANGTTLDKSGAEDKLELIEQDESEGSSGSGSDDEVYDEDDEDDAGSNGDVAAARSIAGSDVVEPRPTLSRQPSATPVIAAAPQMNGVAPKISEGAEAAVAGLAAGADHPGPTTHEPTQCSDTAEHYDRPLIDTTIPAPLGKIYSLVFGPASTSFMRKWHVEEQKSRELNLADTPLDNEHKTLTFDYIKPLGGAVGPKQTKCITTYNLLAFDLEKAVTVDCSTQTPDVPSGNVFATKTRYCLMWGPGNSTRIIANCTIEWTGKSWLKGPIEKGANDGQIQFIKDLVAALKAAVTVVKSPTKGAPRKGKRKTRKETSDADEVITTRDIGGAKVQQDSDWGPLEILHAPLKPLIALLGPFATSQTVIAVLFALLLYTWINPPARKGAAVGIPGYAPSNRFAYEEMWRREENSLWDWLEDRVGLDGVYAPSMDGEKRDRQRVLAARQMGKKVDDEKMGQRQMDSAIKVTEQRLEALKEAVKRQKESKAG